MKKSIFFLSFLSFTISLFASNPLEVKEFTLSNGMRVWINEDSSQPKVFGCVVVNAGAKDSPNTGIAHYFEHIMFKGTDKIGTVNYAVEKPLLDSISAQYDLLAYTTDETKRKDIQKKINDLSVKAAEYAIPNEFDRLIAAYGGSRLNAGTSYDYTVYHNTFTPVYIEQWCKLNSERLINPVFRGFQGELETVYEEKNMYDDALGSQALEKTLERFFAPHPYQYPIIGSSENLKNPKLSEMKAFFNKYYVAENMGLILSGDVNSEEILPIIEKYFGKIRKGGGVVAVDYPEMSSFNGAEKFKAKIPIPLVKINALLWRGVPSNHPDEIAMNLLIGLLNNDNKNGLLDQLSIDGKLMQSMALAMSMNDAGIIGVAAIPNIPFQSYDSAQKHVFAALEKIKKGDFSEEMLNNLKLEQKRNYLQGIEKIDSRSSILTSLFASKSNWQDYLNRIDKIDALTKNDIVQVANKYFSSNYLDTRKSTGRYPNEKMKKPGFAPITPTNKNSESAYAEELKQLPKSDVVPQFLNLNNPDEIIPLDEKGLVTLYYTPNQVNDVFTLNLAYGIGSLKLKTADALSSYLEYLGTDSLSLADLNKRLQALGSKMYFQSSPQRFEIKVSGFDRHFNETVDVLSHFMKNVKSEKSKLSKIISELKVSEKAIRKSNNNIASAVGEKIKYGSQSTYLTQLTSAELKKLGADNLLKDFQTITGTALNIHYAGSTSAEEIAKVLTDRLPIQNINTASEYPLYRNLTTYNEPQIYFYNDSKSTQSIIGGYLPLEKVDEKNSSMMKLFNSYFGGSMSSLMFQEIREFRSLAYRANSWTNIPTPKNSDKQPALNLLLSTQADKTIEALAVLDSIVNDMPLNELRFINSKQDMTNEMLNQYPDFRAKSLEVAYQRNAGFKEDENKTTLNHLADFKLEDMEDFYKKHIQNRPMVYFVVGNEKNIDMNGLAKFGKVIKLKQSDFLK